MVKRECFNSQNVNYTCFREMTRRLYHCNSEIRAQFNYLIKIYLYLYRLLSFKRSRLDPLKLMDLLVLTANFYIMFNMNFTKDLVLCEIIEQHEGKSIIVVNFFFLSDYHTE